MSKALKGALLSALVFPGLGEIMLRSYVRGVALTVIASACLATLVGGAVEHAWVVLDRLQAGGGAVDLDTIYKAANEAVAGADSRRAHAALLFLVVCWALSVVDAYRIGQKEDAEGGGRT